VFVRAEVFDDDEPEAFVEAVSVVVEYKHHVTQDLSGRSRFSHQLA